MWESVWSECGEVCGVSEERCGEKCVESDGISGVVCWGRCREVCWGVGGKRRCGERCEVCGEVWEGVWGELRSVLG